MRWPLVDPPTEGEWVLLSLTWNFHYVGRDVLLEVIAYLWPGEKAPQRCVAATDSCEGCAKARERLQRQ